MLHAHAQTELELFYPAIDVDSLQRELAALDHDEIMVQFRELMHARSAPDHGGDRQPALFRALDQLIRQHMKCEEQTLFPAAAALDLDALGVELSMRRGALLGEQGAD